MFDPSKFTTTTAKPLPVVLLLDISGSMSGDKIDNLNKAVEEMLDTFSQEEKMETEIHVSVITFGSQVELYLPYTKASQVQWQNLQAGGMTPMGVALKMAKAMIEDKETTPSRAYRPTVVIVSDGAPNDDWEKPMDNFISEGRSSKCDRMAMLIGNNSGETALNRFIESTAHGLFYAENAGQLHEFFQRVTMSVTMRTQSKNPNLLPAPSDIKLDSKSITNNQVESSSDEGYW
jgi:uncharacterized protein YegL